MNVCVHDRSREIADGHADFGSTRLGLELRDHGTGQLDAVHSNATTAQRQRDAARADAKLQGGARSCQFCEEAHCRVDNLRIEQLRPQRLVPLCYPLVEVRLGHVAEHAGCPIARPASFSGCACSLPLTGSANAMPDESSCPVH